MVGGGGPWDSSDSPSPLVLGFGDLGTWGLGTGLVNKSLQLAVSQKEKILHGG